MAKADFVLPPGFGMRRIFKWANWAGESLRADKTFISIRVMVAHGPTNRVVWPSPAQTKKSGLTDFDWVRLALTWFDFGLTRAPSPRLESRLRLDSPDLDQSGTASLLLDRERLDWPRFTQLKLD